MRSIPPMFSFSVSNSDHTFILHPETLKNSVKQVEPFWEVVIRSGMRHKVSPIICSIISRTRTRLSENGGYLGKTALSSGAQRGLKPPRFKFSSKRREPFLCNQQGRTT